MVQQPLVRSSKMAGTDQMAECKKAAGSFAYGNLLDPNPKNWFGRVVPQPLESHGSAWQE